MFRGRLLGLASVALLLLSAAVQADQTASTEESPQANTYGVTSPAPVVVNESETPLITGTSDGWGTFATGNGYPFMNRCCLRVNPCCTNVWNNYCAEKWARGCGWGHGCGTCYGHGCGKATCGACQKKK